MFGVEFGDVERIANPIERCGFSQHRPAAAVLHAADDLVFRIVVGRVGILGHVEPGEAARARPIGRILRDRHPHPVEQLQTLAVVHPIGLHDEFLRVHALTRDRHLGGACFGVLLQQALVALRIHPQDVVAGAEGVQLRPPIEMLEGIVGPIVRAPAHEGPQVAAAGRNTSRRTPGRRERWRRASAAPERPSAAVPCASGGEW